MDKNSFNFKLEDKEVPFDVVKKTISIVESASNGYVIAKIENYDDTINSRTSISSFVTALNSNMQGDIQNKLGELENEISTYEVYLSVKRLKNYKYRIFFLEYGSVAYPVTIILNDDIAEYSIGKSKTKYLIYNENDLKKLVNMIINSEYFIKLIQNLINEALRREIKESNQ